MLGTLLEGQGSGAQWPAPREALALVAGGLRARSLLNRRLGLTTGLRLAAVFGLVLVITVWAGQDLGRELAFALHALPGAPARASLSGYQVASEVLSLSAAAACWTARRAVTVTLAGGRGRTVRDRVFRRRRDLASRHADRPGAALARSRAHAKLWLATGRESGEFLLVAPPGLYSYLQYTTWALCAIAVLWVVIDPRPAFAMAIFLLNTYIASDLIFVTSYGPATGPAWTWVLPAASSLVLAAGATWRLRRQLVP